ncbi:hypothetical protein [Cognataquiflexum rubidum]|uniref:hypothetical protein n=1 Tax=Cognataquiflexum rubidum TaxID=2922273 RepID=UPI001F1330CF|nr:hypothetical protein [Cognataquiflexum rubidum]MCH6235707.1 hypothetical protein [Cognataquiflexum rubidum]
MKPTITSFFLLLGVFCFGNAFGQNEGAPRDTIHFHGSDHFAMYILSSDYHKLTGEDQVEIMLVDFQNMLKEIKDKVPTSSSYIIEYGYQTKIEVLESNRIASFSISEGNGIAENFRNQAIITDPNSRYQVNIGFNELDKVLMMDFNKVIGEIKAELPEKDRHLRFLEYQYEGEIGKSKLIQNKISGDMDMLRLSAGIGANVYRSNFLTDISGELAFQFNKKGILKNQFYASTNLMFSFNEDNSPVINTFVNLGYKVNFSSQKDDPNWLGMEFGTIVNRNGDVFKPNTMRLGLNWAVGKGISVAPQLYFNGFFKQVSPGFRIGIGL